MTSTAKRIALGLCLLFIFLLATISVQVHKLFNPLEEEVSCKRVAADGMLLDIAHLIDTKSIEKYQNRYSTAAKQLKNCQMVVSGPWPPYHFLPEKLRQVAGDS